MLVSVERKIENHLLRASITVSSRVDPVASQSLIFESWTLRFGITDIRKVGFFLRSTVLRSRAMSLLKMTSSFQPLNCRRDLVSVRKKSGMDNLPETSETYQQILPPSQIPSGIRSLRMSLFQHLRRTRLSVSFVVPCRTLI